MKWIQGSLGHIGKVTAVVGVFIAIIIVAYAADVDINDPTSCPKGTMNMTAKNVCCTNLNKKRRPFSQCCWYPILVIWKWQFELCTAKCNDDSSTTSANYRCCVLPCCFTYLKVLGSHPERDGIIRDGLIFSFFLSVYNDSRWNETLINVVTRSDEQFRQDIPKIANVTDPNLIKQYEDFWDCFEVIPNYLYDIIDSAYNQNYLQCPIFNDTLDRCTETRQFVQDCFVDYVE